MTDSSTQTAKVLDAPPRRQALPPGPCAMVIFGAGGDLTRRLLVPALYNLSHTGLLPEHFAIVGVDIAQRSVEDWRDSLHAMLQSFIGNPSSESRITAIDDAAWQKLAGCMSYVQGDLNSRELFENLRLHLQDVAHQQQTGGNCLFYLAVSDRFFAPVVEQLGHAGLLDEELQDEKPQRWRRVVIEKPFGHSLPSARELNARIRRELREEQIYRIDHFLGKETVQNIMAFRFANSVFEPVWNSNLIDSVQITAAEEIGVELRGSYYERAGTLRDIVQNHALQLLALVAMEPPIAFEANAVRDEKVKVLRAIRPITDEEVAHSTVRGQYIKGWVLGEHVAGYREEKNVAPGSLTETFAALRLFVDNWRWANVPFYIRAGKRLPKRATEIRVQFKRPPHLTFGRQATQELDPNAITLRIQPEEGISLKFGAKVPSAGLKIRSVNMDFQYMTSFLVETPEAYERLLLDCMIGDPTLFTRADEVETAWKLIDPIEAAWRDDRPPLGMYAAGTWGPPGAAKLLQGDGREWHRP
jgi:glucose-6-phosphate 1-dehydrogenase